MNTQRSTFSVLPLPTGAGKTQAETHRIICSTGIRPGYSSPVKVFFAFSRKEIEDRNLSRLLATFGRHLPPERLRQLRGNVIFTVSGYDDEPTELFEIDEVRSFFSHAHRVWPFWFFFADMSTGCLRLVTACIVPTAGVIRKPGSSLIGVRVAVRDLRAFSRGAIPPAALLYHKILLPLAGRKKIIARIAAYLNFRDVKLRRRVKRGISGCNSLAFQQAVAPGTTKGQV